MGMCNGISNDFTDGGKGKLAKVWDDWRIAMGDSGLDLEEDGMEAGRAVLSGGWIWTRLQRTDEWAWAPLPPERTAIRRVLQEIQLPFKGIAYTLPASDDPTFHPRIP